MAGAIVERRTSGGARILTNHRKASSKARGIDRGKSRDCNVGVT